MKIGVEVVNSPVAYHVVNEEWKLQEKYKYMLKCVII